MTPEEYYTTHMSDGVSVTYITNKGSLLQELKRKKEFNCLKLIRKVSAEIGVKESF